MRSLLVPAVSLVGLFFFAACGSEDDPQSVCCSESSSGASSGSSGGSSGTGEAGASSGGGSTSGAPTDAAADAPVLTGTPTVTRTVWTGSLDHPWDLAFLPGTGGALLSERNGRISRLDAAGVRSDVVGPDDVRTGGEGGLLGLTIDPEFAQNRLVYTCFSHEGTPSDNRVVRWRLSDDGTRLEQRTDLVTGMPYSTGRHSGCRLRFHAGQLYVGTGDAARFANPQDQSSLGGKILRITRDGAAAPGNPAAEGRDPRVFTFGHRNVQGLAEQPGSDRLYSAEHGSDRDDEINLVVPGQNYGWDPGSNGGYDESVPMTDLAKFPTAGQAVWTSGNPTTALSGIAFLSGAAWRDWNGALVGAELKNERLRVLRLDGAGTSSTVLGELCADQEVRLRTPVLGPDGVLYVLTDGKSGGDEIWRLTPE